MIGPGTRTRLPARLRRRLFGGLGLLVLSLSPAQAVTGEGETLIVGRNGWIFDADQAQATLRGDLVDPADLYGQVGFIMLGCDGDGYHLYFSLNQSHRLSVPENIADGFVHFTFGRSEDGDASGRRVSLYVKFASPLAFRSADSPDLRGEPVTKFVNLMRSAALTATMVISPRLGEEGFLPDKRLRLIFEPAPADARLGRDVAIDGFVTECLDRMVPS